MGSNGNHESSMGCPPISSKHIDTLINNDIVKTSEMDSKEYSCSSEKTIAVSDAKDAEILREGVEKKRKGKLLVLDLNGILAHIVLFAPKGYKPYKKFNANSVFKRPFCDDFLKFCFDNFDVGVWSSRKKKNVDGLVKCLMEDMRHQLLFCWDSSHCTNTGFQTPENKHKALVLKELKKLWEKQDPDLPWEKWEYNESNTVLLDDSPYKALRNPVSVVEYIPLLEPYTAIFPRPFTLYDQDDNSLGPGGDIRVYLEGLSINQNIQDYIEQHPFGQRQISSSEDLFHKVWNLKN